MKLQILIVAFGLDDGVMRLHLHPKVEDVEYIVSWQHPAMDRLPKEITDRKDIKIFPTDTEGISLNRNEAFRHATADYVLLSDADLEYSEQHLKAALRAFEENPDISILTFKYRSDDFPKSYPAHEFSLNGRHPKGYSVTSFEIGLNLKNIQARTGTVRELRFNPNFGINGKIPEFICGEEDILLARLLRKGYPGKFLPVEVAVHPGSTTSMRLEKDPDFITTKGACLSYIHPRSWPLRMLAHAWRSSRTPVGEAFPFGRYCSLWLKGVKLARRNRVFRSGAD